MKNKLYLSILLFAGISLFHSCESFIDIDLTNKAVTVMAPANNYTSPTYTVNFWWNELQGADKYQLQIVKPNFTNIQQLIVDTTTTSTQFSYTLQPGAYEWRIRAKNGSSESPYVIYSLMVDSTLDLGGQTMVLASPADNTNTNNLSQTFAWVQMPNADSYLFQVLSSGVPVYTTTTTDPTTTAAYSFAVLGQGTYTWRVSAQNSTSNSPFTTRTIVIDTAAPASPSPTFPINDTITANPVPLQWSSVLTATAYEVQVSNDSTFSLVLKDTVTASTTYNYYNAVIGTYYYWRVKAKDFAGNASSYCTRRRFKRN